MARKSKETYRKPKPKPAVPKVRKKAGRPKGSKQKQTVEATAKLLRATDGNIAEVARRYGLSREGVYAYMENHPELKVVLSEVRQRLVDDSQSGLGRAVRKGTGWAIKFTLSTLGRRRGYVMRQEVQGPEETGGAIPVQVLLPHNGRFDPSQGRPADPEPEPEEVEPEDRDAALGSDTIGDQLHEQLEAAGHGDDVTTEQSPETPPDTGEPIQDDYPASGAANDVS